MNIKRLQEAQALYKEGQLDAALSLYQELAAKYPDQIEISHAIAVILAKAGQLKPALQKINVAISQHPDMANLYNSKGNILMKLKDLAAAINAFKQAIAVDNRYAPSYNNLGNCFYQQNQLIEAAQSYQRAIECSADYIDAHFNLGITSANLGENATAIRELEKTIQLNPTHAKAYGQLAEVYLNQGDYSSAITYYEKRIELQSHHAETYHSLGEAFLHENKLHEAITAFEQAIALNPKHPDCNHHLANAILRMGDEEKALHYFFRQLEIHPLAESYYNIGVILLQKQRHKEALEYLLHAAEKDPSYLPVHLNLGALYLKLNHIGKAIEAYQQALILKPNDPEIKHIITALSQSDTPETAPNEYIEHLFDQYALYYDKHLTEVLNYQAPQLIKHALIEETGARQAEWTILDLGCGTGLIGAELKPFAKKLIGIDIAAQMIQSAKEKKIYDELFVMDVETALQKFTHNDLVVAADVFTYIGNLDSIFSAAKAALTRDGLFMFTVERTETTPYILQQSIRYAHSRAYIESLIKKHEFKTMRFDNIILRQQQRKPIEGFLVCVKHHL